MQSPVGRFVLRIGIFLALVVSACGGAPGLSDPLEDSTHVRGPVLQGSSSSSVVEQGGRTSNRLSMGNVPPTGSIPPTPTSVDDSSLSMLSLDDVTRKRADLIKFIWGDDGFPATKLPAQVQSNVASPVSGEISNLLRVDRLVFDMGHDVKNEAFHFVPQKANGKLVVVQQGHSSTFDDSGVSDTIRALVEGGYGVLGAYMVCLSSLPCPIVPLDPYSTHTDLMQQVPLKAGEGSSLKFFLEHIASSLAYFRAMSRTDGFPAYREFDMTGVSGGGWTTVLYSAVDPSIRISVPSSGSKPMYLRRCDPWPGCFEGYDGDMEQVMPAFYANFGYLDLYALGGAGPGRRQVQVQIRHDSCCFGQDHYDATNGVPGLSWDEAVRAYERKVQNFLLADRDRGWFRFEIDETSAGTHQISGATRAQVILAELDGDRQVFGAANMADVFVKGPDSTLRHLPPAWVPTPTTVMGAPAVVGPNDVFVRDASSRLVHVMRAGDDWAAEPWAGVISADPAGAIVDGELHAVAVGPDSMLAHWQSHDGDVTTEAAGPPLQVVGAPSIVVPAPGRLDVFVRRMDGRLQHVRWLRDIGWDTDLVSDKAFRGTPSAAIASDGVLRVFFRGADDQLWEGSKPLDGSDWTLTSIANVSGVAGMVVYGSPSATFDPATLELVVVARSTSGDLQGFTASSGEAWAHLPMGKPTMPSSAAPVFLTLSPRAVPGGVFARGALGQVWFDELQAGWAMQSGVVY